jgi:hypothetical protein
LLLVKGKEEKAVAVFQRIAKSNRKTFNRELLKIEMEHLNSLRGVHDEPQKSKLTLLVDSLRSKKIRIRLIVTMANWFCTQFVYDGLSINVGNLPGNLYLNYTYSSLVELAAVLASHYALEKFGRKIPYSISMFLVGASLVSIAFVPTSI